jgi:hypothetical protein
MIRAQILLLAGTTLCAVSPCLSQGVFGDTNTHNASAYRLRREEDLRSRFVHRGSAMRGCPVLGAHAAVPACRR